jgi:hypothetical protein
MSCVEFEPISNGYGTLKLGKCGKIIMRPRESESPCENNSAVVLIKDCPTRDFDVSFTFKFIAQLQKHCDKDPNSHSECEQSSRRRSLPVCNTVDPLDCLWFLFNYDLDKSGCDDGCELPVSKKGKDTNFFACGVDGPQLGKSCGNKNKVIFESGAPKFKVGDTYTVRVARKDNRVTVHFGGRLVMSSGAGSLLCNKGRLGFMAKDCEIHVSDVKVNH